VGGQEKPRIIVVPTRDGRGKKDREEDKKKGDTVILITEKTGDVDKELQRSLKQRGRKAKEGSQKA